MGRDKTDRSADRQGPAGTPERTCAVTRVVRPAGELLRFVVGPEGTVVPDLGRRLPGRGVWLACSKDVVAAAVKRKVFSRSLRLAASAPPDLAETVERLMLRRTGEALSLANKAGLVTVGFTRIEAALGRGSVEILVHAADAAPDGVEKLDRQYKAMVRDLGRKPVIARALTVEQLGLALGRANVVHAALSKGGAAAKFLAEVERLSAYRAGGACVEDARVPSERARSSMQD
jgi:uncharacterized protein